MVKEAKDHFKTIEQGLLNLQPTLKNTEIVSLNAGDSLPQPRHLNEFLWADHSLKRRAAMLEINSVQQMAQYLEDYFNLLKEYPHIQIEHKLDSLFLQAFDTLKKLLEQLEDSFPTESVVNNTMLEVEPVFAVLNQHLEVFVNQAGGRFLLGELSFDKAFYSTQITKYYNNIEQYHEWFLANSKAKIKINNQLQNISVASSN